MNSPLAYLAPACAARLAAAPVQAIDIVLRPKISPQPPTAITTASAGKARISIVDQVLRDRAAAAAVVVEHRAQEIPALVHRDRAGGVPAAHLLVEGVEQLLAGGGAGERGALEQRAAEAALIAKAFRRAVERDAQAVHQVDDPRAPVGTFPSPAADAAGSRRRRPCRRSASTRCRPAGG